MGDDSKAGHIGPDALRRTEDGIHHRSARSRASFPAKPAGFSVVDERVRHIMTLMVTCQWVRGVTCYELAEQWGCSAGEVRRASGEASRRVRDASTDAETLERMRGQLEHLVQMAERTGNIRDAIKGLSVLAGISAPKADPTGIPAGMSERELEDAARQPVAESEAE